MQVIAKCNACDNEGVVSLDSGKPWFQSLLCRESFLSDFIIVIVIVNSFYIQHELKQLK